MDVFELLKKDHDKVKKLFKEYEAAGDKAFHKKEDLSEQIMRELENHALMEEEMFYPAIETKAEKKEQELVDEAYEEHQLIKGLIAELRTLKAGEDDFEAKFKVMRENVEHHIEEEENELFPKARKLLQEDAEEIAEEIEERKEDMMEHMQQGL